MMPLRLKDRAGGLTHCFVLSGGRSTALRPSATLCESISMLAAKGSHQSPLCLQESCRWLFREEARGIIISVELSPSPLAEKGSVSPRRASTSSLSYLPANREVTGQYLAVHSCSWEELSCLRLAALLQRIWRSHDQEWKPGSV